MDALIPSSDHIDESTVLRASLRRDALVARLAMDEKTRFALSTRIEAELATLLSPMAPRTLAFCSPIRGEFDARPLATLLIQRGWQAVMPIVEKADSPMSFRQWTESCAMSVDRYGIPIPAAGNTLVPDIVLLPLVAFDPQGFRLGYGGGYFDRTLANLVPRPMAIGVGFEMARVDDIRPQTHDIRLDAVVTEAGTVHPGQIR